MANPNKLSLVAICVASFLLMRGCSLVLLEERDYTHTCQAIQREHKDQWFLYTYESRFDGCTLSCVFLLASTFKYRDYLDKTMTHPHYFHIDKGCIDEDHVSSLPAGFEAHLLLETVLFLWSLQRDGVKRVSRCPRLLSVRLHHRRSQRRFC